MFSQGTSCTNFTPNFWCLSFSNCTVSDCRGFGGHVDCWATVTKVFLFKLWLLLTCITVSLPCICVHVSLYYTDPPCAPHMFKLHFYCTLRWLGNSHFVMHHEDTAVKTKCSPLAQFSFSPWCVHITLPQCIVHITNHFVYRPNRNDIILLQSIVHMQTVDYVHVYKGITRGSQCWLTWSTLTLYITQNTLLLFCLADTTPLCTTAR